jgi:prophage maintenance system killer protein
LEEAQNTILLLSKTLRANALLTEKGQAVLDVVTRYAGAWRLLLDYDEGRLASAPRRQVAPLASFTVVEARTMAAALHRRLAASGQAGSLFGQERGKALEGIIAALDQTFGGQTLYPSAQARAAHLLYFVIKDHPFGDGNKRIASFLFLEYLRRSGLLLAEDGKPRLAGNAVVALALLIAESAPKQKDTMIHLILNLLEDE